MSKHLLSFLLSELKTLRVICKQPGCGFVVEVGLERFLANQSAFVQCRFCGKEFEGSTTGSLPLAQFATAIRAMSNAAERVDLEFILQEQE